MSVQNSDYPEKISATKLLDKLEYIIKSLDDDKHISEIVKNTQGDIIRQLSELRRAIDEVQSGQTNHIKDITELKTEFKNLKESHENHLNDNKVKDEVYFSYARKVAREEAEKATLKQQNKNSFSIITAMFSIIMALISFVIAIKK